MAVIACAAQCWEASCSACHASHHTGASIAVTAVLHEDLWQSWLCFTPRGGLYSSHSCASWRPLAVLAMFHTMLGPLYQSQLCFMETSGSPGHVSHHAGASIAVTAVLHGDLWQSWPCFTPCWGLYSSHSCASWRPLAVLAMFHTMLGPL